MSGSPWPVVALESVAQEITVGHVGPMASEYVSTGIPFLRSQNVEPLRVVATELKFITPDFHRRLAKSRLTPGDVVIVRTGKPGACAVVPTGLPEANCSDLVIVRCGEQLVPRFLAYYVNTVARRHVDAHLVGAVQQHFNVGSARTMQIAMPSRWEQEEIVGILGAFDDMIELNRRTNETLEEMARALFKSWFVDFDPERAKAEGRAPVGMNAATAALFPDEFEDSELGEIPRGWTLGTLGDVADAPRRLVDPVEIDGQVAYIGLEHMPRRSIALSEWATANKVTSQKASFKAGELLFGKLRPYFHKVGVAPLAGVCSTDIIVAMPKAPELFAFLLGHLSSDEVISYADQCSTGTKMPRVSWGDLARYPVVLPPVSVAAAFTGMLRPQIDRIVATIHESRSLAEIRDLLLPKLLSGELRVRDAEKLVGQVA